MFKVPLLLTAVTLTTLTMADATPLVVSVSGQFSASDAASSIVAPGGVFALGFVVDSNPTPFAGSVTGLGFDVPLLDFSYKLNGAQISPVALSEIHFDTLANGGLFDLTIGSGLSASQFIFEGDQVFTGTTAAPAFALGKFGLTSFTFSDPNNFDVETPAGASVLVSLTPEPSSFILFALAAVTGFVAFQRKLTSSFANQNTMKNLSRLSVVLFVACSAWPEVPITQSMNIPNTGQLVTPLAPRGARFTYMNPGLAAYPNHNVGNAVTAITSPDRKTLVVLTTGDYGIYTSSGAQDTANSTDWIFIYDITNPVPVQKQVLQIQNSYNGIVFDPSGTTFYAAGGRNDDVHVYSLSGSLWAEAAGSPIALGHTSQAGGVVPEAAGIAISTDGAELVVTNYENDSITLLTKTSGVWSKSADFDLRPGIINPARSGVPGGAYPFWVSLKGNSTAYVSSMRDREIDVVNISNGALSLITRIKLTGQPLKSTMNASQSTLYVAEDQTDSLAVIDTATNTLTSETSVAAPAGTMPAGLATLSGNNTNSVTLSPAETTLYLTNANTNNVAVVSVAQLGGGNPVTGLLPTGMYPNHVAVSANGKYLYVVNGKSPTGPNPTHCKGSLSLVPIPTSATCNASNGYSLQLIRAGLQFIPVPTASQLAALTSQVALNNNYQVTESPASISTMAFMASKIQHVIYIIKENRTYDQILGDLPIGNGDPALAELGGATTPNFHSLARNFVTLDNFYDTSEVSYDGWAWSTGALAPDIVLRQTPVNYSFRAGLAYESEGDNRGINLVSRTGTNAGNPDVLPGLTDTDAPDGPGHQINTGYLWNQALRAGLTVRNYGFFDDNIGSAVAYPANTMAVQVHPANPQLAPNTDLYYRGYDLNNADYYLYQEWARDVTANGLANLSLVRMPHDHTGNYGTALSGVNTPELQVADNDYAVGSVIQFIAHSGYANNTLVFVIEDDAQNGADHVDAHRSVAFIVGPYVKQAAVVSTQYNTINFIRTMEGVLGLGPIHLTDAIAQPMADVFDPTQATWTYSATPSALLYNTTLPLPPRTAGLVVPKPTHDAQYWARVTKGLDFSKEDRVEPEAYNRILWRGLKGDILYPGDASLSETRDRYRQALRRARTAQPDKDGADE